VVNIRQINDTSLSDIQARVEKMGERRPLVPYWNTNNMRSRVDVRNMKTTY